MRSYNLYEDGRALRIAFGILVLILSLAGSAEATTWTVDDSGGANFTKIQDAINNASAGDTILVYSGMYYENVNVNKKLILRGLDNGDGKPVVDAGESGSAITLSVGNSMVEGFTAINASWREAGILVSSKDNIIRNNNASNNGYGIYLAFSGNNTLSNNIANSNSDYGIYLVSSGNNMLSANTASNNFAGIRLDASSNNMLKENTANLSFGYGFYVVSFSNNNTLTGNTASNNGAGIYLHSSNNNSLNSNIVSNNNGGIFLQYSSSDNFLNNNTFSYSSIGVSVGSFSNNNTFDSNTISNNNYGIDLAGFSNDNIIYNKFYNNIFNNNNTVTIFSSINKWNTIKTIGKNIIGGPYLGGNFWANPNSTGYSQTCADNDKDGICDLPYKLDSNNTDYLPLVVPTAPPTGAPDITSFSPTNSTVINNEGESRTFSITTNQTVNVSWLINETEVFNETGVLTSSYTNYSAALGMWNVSTLAQNTNGSDMQTWIWNVTRPIIGNGSISGYKINDTNGNGKWNAGEKCISNWTIRLIGITGKGKNAKVIRKETLTDATGFYMFDNLSAGRYFVIEKLKKGFVPTSSPVKRIKLSQGKNSMNNNFTNRPVQSRDKKDDKRNIDDYEAINRDIDKYKEDMNWE